MKKDYISVAASVVIFSVWIGIFIRFWIENGLISALIYGVFMIGLWVSFNLMVVGIIAVIIFLLDNRK